MQNKALLLITLLIASGSVLAEQDLPGNAGKQLLKDTATSAAPKEAVKGVEAASQTLDDIKKLKEGVKSAPDALKGQAQDVATETAKKKPNEAVPEKAKGAEKATSQTLEDANKLKESVKSAPESLKGQAQDVATETAKKKLNKAVPEKAKQGVKTVEKGTKTAKKLKGKEPKSSGEATKAIEGKAKEEATKKALDVVK